MDAPASAMDVRVKRAAPPVVSMHGMADFHNREQISQAFDELIAEGAVTIQADLSGLQYIDSSALSTLVRCAVRARDAGGAVELTGISDQVSKVLTVCGAAMFFESRVADVPVCDGDTRNPADGFWHVSSFSIPANPGAAAAARQRVAEALRSLPMSLSDTEDVMIAAGEAITNAIRHGCKCDPDMRIGVRCVAGPSRLAIDITDPGTGFSPLSVPDPSPCTITSGGMGIYIMRELMDDVSFSFDGCTCVRLVKRLRSRQPVDDPEETRVPETTLA